MVGTLDVRIGDSWIDFGPFVGSYANCDPGPNPGACAIDGTTSGSVLFTSGLGSFSTIGGTFGTIADLEDDFAPVGSTFSLSSFLTMAAQPTYQFTLTFIPVGSGTAAGCTNNVGDVCTPPGSPFTLTNVDSDMDGVTDRVSVGFSVDGTIFDGIGPITMFTGTFTTQFLGFTALSLLNAVSTLGFVQNSNSSTFTAQIIPGIPEPATLVLFGTGAAVLAVRRRRQNRKV